MPRNASLKKSLDDNHGVVSTSSPQDVTPQNSRPGEADYVLPKGYGKTTQVVARPEYAPFANALHSAMLKQKLSASEVARRVWGTTKDTRGYDVARNRDRIGHYLAGTSYPEPENLQLLADALGLPIEDLAIDRPAPVASTVVRSDRDTQLTFLAGHLNKARLQVDRVLDADLALRIAQMIKEADQKVMTTAMPPTGRSFGKPEPELRGVPAHAAVSAPTVA